MSRRLLVVCNDMNFFLLHRLPETLGALKAGYEVHVATPPGERLSEVKSYGFVHHSLPLSRSGCNPMREIYTVTLFYRLFQNVRPDLVYLMTIKPILYGGIAARLAGINAVVASVFGLGFIFTDKALGTSFLRVLVSILYRAALKHRNLRVIFQNPSDRDLLVNLRAVAKEKTVMIQGSGVDLNAFQVQPEPDGPIVVLMAARLLGDKGVREFIEAVHLLKTQGVIAQFLLAGEPDAGNPSSISSTTLNAWKAQRHVRFLGYCADMKALLAASHIVVLPSYREGLPRVLEEAAACGRAIVTTNVPGCRDAIEPGVTGLLVPVRDPISLAQAIRRLIEDHDLRQQMGRSGRLLAERCYAMEIIVTAHLAVYRELLGDV